ncbi:hypothetical protein PHMEG_00035797 [Phytophthora megakarya]|uniref:Uncharacterized protein n=1 Tax=Phytophthora megakarya TaxID=4795 RepID=A0A225UMY4_9STRA|nr:hypothetical protein PHMEG_00035797 [Phytophthora megakarya]
MFEAAINKYEKLEVVKWLMNRYVDDSAVDLFVGLIHRQYNFREDRKCILPTIAPDGQTMVIGGVWWLYDNRSGGCYSKILDDVASSSCSDNRSRSGECYASNLLMSQSVDYDSMVA